MRLDRDVSIWPINGRWCRGVWTNRHRRARERHSGVCRGRFAIDTSGANESRPVGCRCRNQPNVGRRRCTLDLVVPSSLDDRDRFEQPLRDRERRIRDGTSPGTLTHGNEWVVDSTGCVRLWRNHDRAGRLKVIGGVSTFQIFGSIQR